jgi:hypothetical protein
MNQALQPWTDAYLRAAIRQEVDLARAMGHVVAVPNLVTAVTTLRPTTKRGYKFMPPSYRPGDDGLPFWRRNWNAAGPLSTDLGISVIHDPHEGTVSAGAGGGRRNITESYADHPSPDAATWAAIVGAAIRLLEAQNSM